MSVSPKTLLDKIWDSHIAAQEEGAPTVLYIDAHLIHEVTSPQAFSMLRERGLKVRRTERTFATMDHATPTRDLAMNLWEKDAAEQVQTLTKNCAEYGITLFDLESKYQGIVHIIGPELGITQPGMTMVCGDSHTATHGAFGALAFGIGTSEVGHVLATQCLLQRKPKSLAVEIIGKLGFGVTAKDIILAVIREIGVDGGTGCVIEYRGETIKNLSMEERMTVCNMSIEAGARAGLIAPDEVTYAYLKDRKFAPKGSDWDKALAYWKTLPTDDGAIFDKTVTINAEKIAPMVTYGTNPGHCAGVDEAIPLPESLPESERNTFTKALDYMGFKPGSPIAGLPVDYVFIGSCTNGRIEDLRQAAEILKDKKISPNVRALIVPGSKLVKQQAEAEGLDKIFINAGCEWRNAGCSMCLAMNEDRVPAGKYCASSSNRNFEGRQGKGARTLLMSPSMAAAAAIFGKVTDVRGLLK